jgi:hypothetical protein
LRVFVDGTAGNVQFARAALKGGIFRSPLWKIVENEKRRLPET